MYFESIHSYSINDADDQCNGGTCSQCMCYLWPPLTHLVLLVCSFDAIYITTYASCICSWIQYKHSRRKWPTCLIHRCWCSCSSVYANTSLNLVVCMFSWSVWKMYAFRMECLQHGNHECAQSVGSEKNSRPVSVTIFTTTTPSGPC